MGFSVTSDEKGLKAVNVRLLTSSEATIGGLPVYIGHIRNYQPDKGWGHIECPDTKAIYGKDILLLRTELPSGIQGQRGDKVTFSVHQDSRGLKAVNIQFLEK